MVTFVKFLFSIIPPDTDDPALLKRWRLGVFAAIVGLGLAFLGFGAVSFGFVPGVSGFAKADIARENGQRISSIEASILAAQLLDMRERQCRAIQEQNQAAMKFASDQMQEKRAEYFRITRTQWNVPSCEELIL